MDKKGQKRSRPASSGEKTPRPYKRQHQKQKDARTIAVQSPSLGSPSPSHPSIPPDSLQLLHRDPLMSTHSPHPGPLKSRLYRLRCVNPSCPLVLYLLIIRAVLAQRAFQDVPRSLRRRSASHNVKRVPRPLREKAMKEMVADGTKPPIKIRGQKRLRMEKRRLAGKVSVGLTEQPEEMDIVEEGIPKLKPRKVTEGKFAHRQGYKTGYVQADVGRR